MAVNQRVIVGIIGGTGFGQDPELIKDKKLVNLEATPYGRATDSQAISGLIEGVQVYVISRHGKNHDTNPSHVNYRANLWTLVKQLGCTHILVTSACGSLKEELKPGDIGVLDQYIDRTCGNRERSFYKVCHVQQREPVNKRMQKFIKEACDEQGIACHERLTSVTIEGPRFSTLAESNLYRSWNCDVINMTLVPEVQLAAELATMYACVLLITDYDCWRDNEEEVRADIVVQRMKDMGAKARRIIPAIIRKIAAVDWEEEQTVNKNNLRYAIMTE